MNEVTIHRLYDRFERKHYWRVSHGFNEVYAFPWHGDDGFTAALWADRIRRATDPGLEILKILRGIADTTHNTGDKS